MNIAVLGAMWGDEGKGHITHHLAKDFDWVIRFNGGANAGHTIYQDMGAGRTVKLVHNLLPSADFFWKEPNFPDYPQSKVFLASGMVIDLGKLHQEIEVLEHIATGYGWNSGQVSKRVYVDPDAFVVLPEHKEEDKATNAHIGSTNRGIGPAYKDKIGRTGTRVKDLIKKNHSDIESLKNLGVQFKHALELKREFEHADLLFEGAQGIMLDINHGTYPYVSCSDCTVAGIFSAGFSSVKLDRVYGVAKCYTTKVGEGPFPAELEGKEAEALRERGNEYGATTGRPRRIGWLDLPALDYACQKGGITDLILTKFDILNGMDRVKMCVAYDKPPMSPSDFFDAVPQYITVPGWEDAKDHDQLSAFVQRVERATGLPVAMISAGTKAEDITQW